MNEESNSTNNILHEYPESSKKGIIALIFGSISLGTFLLVFSLFMALGRFASNTLAFAIIYYIFIPISIVGIVLGAKTVSQKQGKIGLILSIIALVCLLTLASVFTWVLFFFYMP